MAKTCTTYHQVALVTLVVTSLAGSAGAVFGIPEFLEFGSCAQVDVVPDFDRLRYSGLWYDSARVPNEYQVAKHCVTQNYTWTDEQFQMIVKGLTLEERKVYIPMALVNDEVEGDDGQWRPRPPADMSVVADGMPDSPYQVLSTDYDHYSCIYSCSEYFGFRASFLWVLSRTPQIEPQYYQICRDTFISFGIDHTKLIDVRQGEQCPYYNKLMATTKTPTTTATTPTTTATTPTTTAATPTTTATTTTTTATTTTTTAATTTTTTTATTITATTTPQPTSPKFIASVKKDHGVVVKTEQADDSFQASNDVIDEPPCSSTWGKQPLVQSKGKEEAQEEEENTQDDYVSGRAPSIKHSRYLFAPFFVLVLVLTA